MSQPQQITIPQALQVALKHHQSGRLQEAEAIYRQILAAEPNHSDALHLLGSIALQVGQNETALGLFDRAIAAQPNAAVYHCNRGEALNRLNRPDEAIAACQRALALKSGFPEAINNLGIAHQRKGDLSAAIGFYQQAISLKPNFVLPYYNLSSALRDQRRYNEAIDVLKKAIALRPDYPEALNNLGSLLHSAKRHEEAIATFRQAVAMRPNLPEMHFNLGNALRDVDEFDEAIASFQKALALRPNFPEALLNLGLTYQDQRREREAIEMYRKAVALRPTFGEAHNNLGDRLCVVGQYEEALSELNLARSMLPNSVEVHTNLGNALHDVGKLEESIQAHRRAIELEPTNPSANYNLGLTYLLGGNFERGWPQYEWRRKVARLASAQFDLPQPIWNGSDFNGRRILLHSEQGLGDTIHFVRYVPMVAQRGGKVILACQHELGRLLRNVDGVSELIIPGDPMPSYDEHCPLPSLPSVFRTTAETIPSKIPYIHADALLTRTWESKIASDGRVKIGIAWAGRPEHNNDHNRSISLRLLEPLLRNPPARFISLQKGPAASQVRELPAGIELVDFSTELSDFADTAAVIANLDLVIAVDTSVAHVAGAMGKPVWVLIPVNPDWRWMLARSDTPWYPTMRLFRQTRFGDWSEPIERIAQQLNVHLSA